MKITEKKKFYSKKDITLYPPYTKSRLNSIQHRERLVLVRFLPLPVFEDFLPYLCQLATCF